VFTVHARKPPLKLKQRRDQIYMEMQLQPGPAGWGAERARDCWLDKHNANWRSARTGWNTSLRTASRTMQRRAAAAAAATCSRLSPGHFIHSCRTSVCSLSLLCKKYKYVKWAHNGAADSFNSGTHFNQKWYQGAQTSFWANNFIFIHTHTTQWPPLLSSGQSPGFDSRRYQILWEVVGL
jgi:hypothetical protein